MKPKSNKRIKCESGITLIALIISIIILVILAAISINAIYKSKTIDYAINGATDYAIEMGKENEIMSGTAVLIDSTINKIEDILGGKDLTDPGPTPEINNKPTFEEVPVVAKVEKSNTSLTITAKATDIDNDELTYTLCDAAGNAISGVKTQTVSSGQSVTFIHNGLENFSTHTYIVKVSDGKVEVASSTCTGTTYCKGIKCIGGTELTIKNAEKCTTCLRRNNHLWGEFNNNKICRNN